MEPHSRSALMLHPKFQSLRGFGVDWSDPNGGFVVKVALFQSLRGFGVDWSWCCATNHRRPPHVSIPERVWGGLERLQIEE
ncbi:hypothetical protein GFS31_43920 (plasmid) [Leptolyngbya sp. BL0902]|nr:hypothetical protein GFS31_43920 [Leptolyngbya sp. BL0902]